MNVETRSSRALLSILTETPSRPTENLSICGSKLPTVLQVLLCFKAHTQKARREDATKQAKLLRTCAKMVVKEVLIHIKKAKIPTINANKIEQKVMQLNEEYNNMVQIKPNIRKQSKLLSNFQAKLGITFTCWPKNVFKIMETLKRAKISRKSTK